jgi:anti-sigma factor RsiW
MNDHLLDEDVRQFLQGNLAADRARAVLRHLDECSPCAASARGNGMAVGATRRLASQLADADEEHPDLETELTAYADGLLEGDALQSVEGHLHTCARCRADVADLLATADAIRPRSYRARWLAVAAVVILAIATAAILLRKTPAAPATPPVAKKIDRAPAPAPPVIDDTKDARIQWQNAVDDALRSGALRMPAALARLQLPPDTLRKPPETSHATLDPAGAIVESTRPRMTWTSTPGAIYVVSIFDGDTPVAESGKLRAAEWRPDRDLRPGRTYQWQVEVRAGEETSILPAPPAPPALFRVLEAPAHEELEQARAARGHDPLLLGILYARHGLRVEAERELRKVDSPIGRRLLQSVQRWPR